MLKIIIIGQTDHPTTSSGSGHSSSKIPSEVIGGIVVGCVAAAAIVFLLVIYRKRTMKLLRKNNSGVDTGIASSSIEMSSQMRRSDLPEPQQCTVHEIGSPQQSEKVHEMI